MSATEDTNEACAPEDSVMRVTLFGGLSIIIGDTVIKDSSSRRYQLWNLLEYLIAFRKKTISPVEMYGALWGGDDIENPASALKNLVYRIRTVFAGYNIPFAKNIITYSGGTYQWNNDIPCVVDVEEFEELYKRAGNASQPAEMRIESYMQAIELYKGDFLAASNHKHWIVPVCSYYKSLYFKSVYELLRILSELERYGDMEMICQKALLVDQFEEELHHYLIQSLIRQDQQGRAIAHYKFVSDLFLRELGVQPSSALRDLYRKVTKTVHNVEIDLGIIKQDLKETDSAAGSYYCEYETFKNIYQVFARMAPRKGLSVFVALFTLTGEDGDAPDDEVRKKAMGCLFRILKINTRRCDVFARFSATQYVLLLPTTSVENCNVVIRRISHVYRQNFKIKGVELTSNIQPMDYS